MPTAQSQKSRVPLGDASARTNQDVSGVATPGLKPPHQAQKTMSWEEAEKAAMAVFNAEQPASKDVPRNPQSEQSQMNGAQQDAAKAKPAAAEKTKKRKSSSSTGASTDTGSAASKKRKAEQSLEEDIANYTQDLNDRFDPDGPWGPMDESCQKVRGRLTRLFDNDIMTKTAFCDAIGVSSHSLRGFLTNKGTMGGQGSSTYDNAWVWFKQRELAGLKMPDAKRRKQKIADQQAKDKGTATPSGKAPAKDLGLPDISDIELPGEGGDVVACFDNCDEVRRKINAHMKIPGVTAAQFCRDLFAQLSEPETGAIQSSTLTRFRNAKGPVAGAKSIVYYTAYVYFEKLRIAQGRPKTEHRKRMEEAWGVSGMRRDADDNTRFLTCGNERPWVDEFGKFHFGHR
ncbi:uncharacterized protein B0I36DRAFT_318596 [Microdochium trichocladiopsis]|uniref:DUF7726 domain-containing protein n=1 Tax=Microdochium trichocladiopsis TaxID=1682393 RepID=A0A9P8YEN9_9PEZI|nr:uncharacterized protein B0I36DRAFT_318596 [Microdochium trichocladiopsis]KAH7035561.1 hypothetical protein B0I36DRAFT_318596 [Microdochium trichocladiopsis]